MRRLGVLRPARRRDEKGAMAVLVAIFAIVMFGCAALAVDVASLSMERQKLHDHVDAAAHAGAMELPANGASAKTWATSMAKSQDPSMNPAVNLYCVVKSTGASKQVAPGQIPATCDPGTYSSSTVRCNTTICSIPCPTTGKCNTVRVSDTKVVPYRFGPVIGQNQGSTGSVTSAACKGSCGQESPNPLDVVIMADRTASMVTADRQAMKSAILESLKAMNPEMHYVAFGTIHKSRTSGFTTKANSYGPQNDDYAVTGADDTTSQYNYNGHWDGTGKTQATTSGSTCLSEASTAVAASSATPPILQFGTRFRWNGRLWGPYAAPDRVNPMQVTDEEITSGTWIPVGFTNNYLLAKTNPSDPSVLNSSSDLIDSISCLPQSIRQEYGTNLASAMKGAVTYAFGQNPAPTRPGTIRKVIVFETDGQPSEPRTFGDTSLTSGDVGNRNGSTGCSNLTSVADAAKAKYGDKLLIITIGFGDAATAKCGTSGTNVRDVLADAASDTAAGASDAESCDTQASQDTENGDGDYFFCSTKGSDLASIFATAITQASNNVRLINLP